MYALTEDFVRRLYRRWGGSWAANKDYIANVSFLDDETGSFGQLDIEVKWSGRDGTQATRPGRWKILAKNKDQIVSAAKDAVENFDEHVVEMHKRGVL